MWGWVLLQMWLLIFQGSMPKEVALVKRVSNEIDRIPNTISLSFKSRRLSIYTFKSIASSFCDVACNNCVLYPRPRVRNSGIYNCCRDVHPIYSLRTDFKYGYESRQMSLFCDVCNRLPDACGRLHDSEFMYCFSLPFREKVQPPRYLWSFRQNYLKSSNCLYEVSKMFGALIIFIHNIALIKVKY